MRLPGAYFIMAVLIAVMVFLQEDLVVKLLDFMAAPHATTNALSLDEQVCSHSEYLILIQFSLEWFNLSSFGQIYQ